MTRFHRFAVSLVVAGALLPWGIALRAQMPSRSQKADVSRVGARLACQCGCSDTVATCSMLGCSFSHPAKERIAKMAAQGVTDQHIIDEFIKEYGPGIYRAPPSAYGWIIPYVALGVGLLVVLWFARRSYGSRKPAPAVAYDPSLSRYNDQIEKELSDLD